MQSKTIQKYKKYTIPQLKEKATRVFNKFIRVRDSKNGYFTCISCKRTLQVKGKQCQAGHFYSGGKYPELKFNENNVHAQCLQCNYFEHGNLNLYRQNLIKKIGVEAVEELDMIVNKAKKVSFKWDRFYLIEIIGKYK